MKYLSVINVLIFICSFQSNAKTVGETLAATNSGGGEPCAEFRSDSHRGGPYNSINSNIKLLDSANCDAYLPAHACLSHLILTDLPPKQGTGHVDSAANTANDWIFYFVGLRVALVETFKGCEE